MPPSCLRSDSVAAISFAPALRVRSSQVQRPDGLRLARFGLGCELADPPRRDPVGGVLVGEHSGARSLDLGPESYRRGTRGHQAREVAKAQACREIAGRTDDRMGRALTGVECG